MAYIVRSPMPRKKQFAPVDLDVRKMVEKAAVRAGKPVPRKLRF